ncbi:MAG: hypothetical protein CVU71_07170 [Deltaproteobacteria bacterium HGW-Deltaproteobacteria-6]|jgi:hypothetical protein|nr:MAG: hypothetical protein CVU71_07170 [Deltaproteobacteria bacterium HGW-Deltaproteobacteria-6]
MSFENHYEGFAKEKKFNLILAQSLCECPVLQARTVKRIIAHVDEGFVKDLFKRRPCIRRLVYIGCGCVEFPCPHGDSKYFKEGEIYTSIDFNGGTYTIEGYEDGKTRIGSAYFEWLKDDIQ